MAAELDALVQQLSGGDADQQAAAAEALAHLGPGAAPAVVAIVQACGSADDSVREWAAAALEELGPPPTDTIEELTRLAGHQSSGVEYWAITLLGRAGADAQPAVGVLVKMLGANVDGAVRERAAWALGKIGTGAKAAVPALRAAASSDSPRLVRLANEALAAIDE